MRFVKTRPKQVYCYAYVVVEVAAKPLNESFHLVVVINELEINHFRFTKPLRPLFSWYLDVLAGHGHKPERTLVAYLIAILSSATAYSYIVESVGPYLSSLGTLCSA